MSDWETRKDFTLGEPPYETDEDRFRKEGYAEGYRAALEEAAVDAQRIGWPLFAEWLHERAKEE